MKIKFNNESYIVQQNVFNKKLDGYLCKGSIIPLPPKGTKSLGVIDTSEGCFGVLARDWKKLWLVPAAAILGLGVFFLFSFVTRGVEQLNYPIKFNDSMVWSEGFVNVNLVNDKLPIQISIQGEGFTSDMYAIEPHEVLKQLELQVPLAEGENKVKIIYTVDNKDYPYDAIITLPSGEEFCEKPVEDSETPVTPDNPFEDEVVIE